MAKETFYNRHRHGYRQDLRDRADTEKTAGKAVDSAAYYKAAMSGNQRDADGHLIPGDALHVKEVSGISQPLETMCPYVYEAAVSPHLASRLEGDPVQMEVVKVRIREGLRGIRLCDGGRFRRHRVSR